MEQHINVPLSQRVKECIDANLPAEEGHLYVGIYIRGYNLIVNLLKIMYEHHDPQVRIRAKQYLDDFDKRGSIGDEYNAAYKFCQGNKLKIKSQHRKGERGMRRLRISEEQRIQEFSERNDLEEEDSSEAKRIRASIFDNKVLSVDYDKLRR